ncbi:peptidase [Rhizoctonia solani]|uniref:Peptidase n=1 Tax=Rhizoctonia solani TaxID=456999 RepID=A0A8H7I3C8_9AGAM|nr:peptidase [Rhizoctonia solani]
MIGFVSAAFLTLVSLADALPTPKGRVSVLSTGSKVKTNSYIISLKSQEVADKHMNWINTQVAGYNSSWVGSQFNQSASQGRFTPHHQKNLPNQETKVSLHIASFLTRTMRLCRWRMVQFSKQRWLAYFHSEAAKARSDIEFIEEDQIMRTTAVQENAPWGLQRISSAQKLPAGSRANALAFTYTFNETAGRVLTSTPCFFGFAAQGLPKVDDQGHGTHCAGTIASKDFGVAKAANVIAVKVLGADGSGATSDIVDGIQFAMQSAAQSGRPSVISMSLGGGVSRALDNAVTTAVRSGMHVVVAAGNEAADASTSSPARAPAVITVGASNINDQVASFSNFGQGVDIFAPGEQVISTFIGSTTARQILSGTSMACPHVAGMVASILSSEGNLSPADMATRIKGLGTANALSRVPQGTTNLVGQLPHD